MLNRPEIETTMQNPSHALTSNADAAFVLQTVKENALIGRAERIPISAPTPIVSVSPVTLPSPERAVDLQLRVSAPTVGRDLPVIVLSHGYGRSNFISSMRGYGPLVDFYSSHGFVVIQPTHLSSKSLGLDPTGPEGALFWRSRAEDMRSILDRIEEIEAAVPSIKGRLDRSRMAAVGHSMGGHTVAMLAGMTVADPVSGEVVTLTDERFRARVMFGTPGAGVDLAPWGKEHYPVLGGSDFSQMRMPVLVVAGDKDANPNFSERHDWRMDAYAQSPGPKCLLTIFGGEHILGGISGYDAAETSDEDPERVATVARLTWAYLRSELYPEDPAWSVARAALEEIADLGRVDCK